jgi:hypothetical protein
MGPYWPSQCSLAHLDPPRPMRLTSLPYACPCPWSRAHAAETEQATDQTRPGPICGQQTAFGLLPAAALRLQNLACTPEYVRAWFGPGLHLSGAREPRLKSLELPLCVCIYMRTYIYIHTSVHVAARNLPGFCPARKPQASSPLSPSVSTSTTVDCPVLYRLPCTPLHCDAPHCTALH